MVVNYSALGAFLLPRQSQREIHPQKRDIVNPLMQHHVPIHPVPISPGERRKESKKIDYELLEEYLTESSEGIILSATDIQEATRISQFFRNRPYQIQVKKLSPEDRKLNDQAQFYIGIKRV